jgi:hypothetical protein
MKNALEFGLKSFFAGCLGMLGAISMFVAAAVIFGLIFRSQIQGLQEDTAGMFQSIPDMLSDGLSGMVEEGSSMLEEAATNSGNPEELSNLFVYLTEGGHPDNEKLTSLTKEQAANVSIWVKTPAEFPFSCELELTMPDGTKHPIGQGYNSDPSMEVQICGNLDLADPPAGVYILEAFSEGSSLPAGKLEFNITE